MGQLSLLDLSPEELGQRLEEAVGIVVDLYRGVEERRVIPRETASAMKALFNEPLPEQPSDLGAIMKRVETDIVRCSTMNIGPNYYGFVTSGGNHVGIIAELLGGALDQNPAKWVLSPVASELELLVIRWISEFMGLPADTGGVLVSGGSAANLTCLKAARDHQFPGDIRMRGIRSGPQMTMYVSTEGHSCLDKSVDQLGIGREFLRKIPVLDDFTIDLEALDAAIQRDRAAGYLPACVIGNGGTVNTGAIDPLNDLADLVARHSMWLHVDAAYGGPAAGTAAGKGLFAGLDRADSVGTDAHKWLYAQFESGVALVRHHDRLRKAFSVIPDYLREENGSDRYDSTEYHFQLSRNFKALRVWMAFKAYGRQRLAEAIEGNMKTIGHLAGLIDASPDFERLAPVPLSVVCFRYRTDDPSLWENHAYLSLLNKAILGEVEKDGRAFVSGTLIRNMQALRACSVNHRTGERHVEALLGVVREIGKRVHGKLRDKAAVQQELTERKNG